MFCQVCQVDVQPYAQLSQQHGVRHKCPRCDGGLQPEPVKVVSEGADGSPLYLVESAVETESENDLDVAEVAAPAPRSAVVLPARKAVAEPVDVLAIAKARLVVVSEQIEQLRALESEAALLRRMIDAAEPLAPVIPFAKQGHS